MGVSDHGLARTRDPDRELSVIDTEQGGPASVGPRAGWSREQARERERLQLSASLAETQHMEPGELGRLVRGESSIDGDEDTVEDEGELEGGLDDDEDEAPTRLGRYLIIERVGAGGMGAVYGQAGAPAPLRL